MAGKMQQIMLDVAAGLAGSLGEAMGAVNIQYMEKLNQALEARFKAFEAKVQEKWEND